MLSEHGVSFREPDFKDLFDTIYGNASDRYSSEFTSLCSTFLNLFKSNGYTPDKMQQLKNRDAKCQSAFFENMTEMFKSIVLAESGIEDTASHSIRKLDTIHSAGLVIGIYFGSPNLKSQITATVIKSVESTAQRSQIIIDAIEEVNTLAERVDCMIEEAESILEK